MTDIATMLAQLEALKAARRSGALEVQHKESRMRYRDDVDMAKAQWALEAEIEKLQGVRRVRNVVVRSPRDRGW